MIELRIDIDQIDYDTVIPTLLPKVIKNPIASKAAMVGYKAKTKNMTKEEKDAFAAKILSDNKNSILTALNSKLSDNGIRGYVVGFDADII